MKTLATFALCTGALFAAACGKAPSPSRPLQLHPERSGAVSTVSFAAGSYIIPMDTTYQDNGTLEAFGLIYQLLRGGVPVTWSVLPGKLQGQADFTASATDVKTAATISGYAYKAGPFIIDSSNASVAQPIIAAWQAGHTVAVHRATASFSAPQTRVMIAAPMLAVLNDTYQSIAFNYLNAAGIPDSQNKSWSNASVDVLSEAQVAGPTTGGAYDSALLNADGTPKYCHITSMHYNATTSTDEVVREVRHWLTASPTHAFFECAATTTVENDVNGSFLSTPGLAGGTNIQDDSGGVPATNTSVVVADIPFSQFDGTFQGTNVGSAVYTIGLATTKKQGTSYPATYKNAGTDLIHEAGAATDVQGIWMSGFLDASSSNGKVTWLGGHSYSTTEPISANPMTNGVRLFLNSLFDSPCVTNPGATATTMTGSMTGTAGSGSAQFSIAYQNSGTGTASNVTITDTLPAGLTFTSATGGGTASGQTVTWSLGTLSGGASGTVTVSVSAVSGTYGNTATIAYDTGVTHRAVTASASVTVGGTPPVVTLSESPSTTPTNQTSISFTFTSSPTGATFQCSLDSGTAASCASPRSYSGLSSATHTFSVTATDSLGNVSAPATYAWTVDTTAPVVTLGTPTPAGSPTNQTTISLPFSANKSGSTFRCALDGAASAACSSPFAAASLGNGAHSIAVTATDLAGNVSTPATYAWTVDTTAPVVTLGTPTPSASKTNQTAISLPFSASKSATFACALDAAAAAPCSSPVQYSTLADGAHTITVTATDAAGNVSAPASYGWSISTVPPDTLILAAPPLLTRQTTASFAISSLPVGDALLCSLDGAAFATCGTTPSYASLADGVHRFAAKAVDAYGNVDPTPAQSSWTVDTRPPAAPVISAPQNGATLATDVPAISGVAEAGSTVAVYVDGVQVCSAVADVNGNYACTLTARQALRDGAHVITATATDRAGNVSPQASPVDVNTATSAPVTAIVSGPTNPSNQTSAAFVLSANRSPVTYACSLDGAAYAACTSTPQFSGLAAGAHTLRAQATDAQGHADPTPPAWSWTIVTATPPAPAIAAPTSGATLSTATPTFSGTSAPGSTVALTVDGIVVGTVTADSTGAFSFTLPASEELPDGPHAVTAQATDAAGNQSAPSAATSFSTSTAAPDTTIVAGPPAATNSSSASFKFASTHPAATFQCSLDGAAFSACPATFQLSGVAPGGHLLAVRAVDSIADPTPAFWPWTIDTSLPAAPLFSAPANGSTLGSATPTLAGTTVPGAAVVITVDGAVVGTVTADANGDFSFTLTTPLADGSHQVTAQAKDPAGNTSPASAVLGFSTLATPPSTTLTQKPTALTNVAAAQFAFTGNRSDDVFECSLDGGAFASCTSPKSYTLPDGPHTFVVRARDILGNVDQNPPSYTWTIDTTPPVVTLGTPSPASSPTHVTSMSLPFSANETSTFTCALDSVAPAVCSSPAGYASLADGAHTIAVVATDAAGNASAPARYAWTVDTVLPVVSLTATPAAALTNQTSIGFTFTADKAGSAFQCSIDSATAAACSSPKGYSGLADGNHSFTVTATDPAGNLSAPATHAWTVNTTPPPAPIIVAPAEGQVLYTATPAISGTAAVQTQLALAVDGTQVASLAVQPGGSWSYTLGAGQALADGTHVATAVATDAAGNLSPQALRDFSTHSALPHTTIVSAPARSTNQRTAAFVFASDIAGSTFECALDGASFAPCANPYNLSGLVEAQHSLSVRAKDPAGRFDPTPPSWLWTVDLTPPAAPIITYPADQQTIATRTPVLTGTAEPNALVRVFVDDMEVGMASGAAQVPSIVLVDGSGHWSIAMPPVQALSTGAHVAIAQTTDQAGNTGPTSAPNQFFVAGAPPATAITAGPAAFTNATAASFTIVATPAGDALDCALDGAAFAPCSSPAAYAGLAAGAHLFSARARDAAGAVDPAPPTWAWVIDLTPPAAPVIAVPVANATVPTATPVISGTAEANASVSVSVDGAAIGTTLADGSGNWSIAVPPPDALANGAHLATARATDQAGNAGPPSAPTPFSVLSTAPDTFVLSGPSAWTRLSSATLAFGSDRSPATYQCRVDGAGGFSSCPQMLTLSGMTDGAHLVEVSAIDAAGNVDPSPATWSWTVDQTPPAPPQIVLPMRSSLLHTATPAVAGSAQPFASVDVWVDGAPEGSASADAHGQWILVLTRPQALLDGPHAAVAQATDAAGNQSAASASDPFTTLTGAPTTSVLTGPAALTNATAASFTFGSNRSPVTYQCALDGAAGAACNQAQAWSGFAEGRHLISVQAADAAGNVDPAPATWQWTVDTTPPHTTIVRAPPATTNSNSAGFAFAASKEGSTFECALDGASFASCQSSLIFQVSDGAHTLLARAVDLAGNRDPAPASATWTVQHVVTFAGGGCSSADATTAAAALGLLVLLWRRRRQAARLP